MWLRRKLEALKRFKNWTPNGLECNNTSKQEYFLDGKFFIQRINFDYFLVSKKHFSRPFWNKKNLCQGENDDTLDQKFVEKFGKEDPKKISFDQLDEGIFKLARISTKWFFKINSDKTKSL